MSSPSGRSESPFGHALLVAVGVAGCCGLPLLLAAGATVTIAGLGIRSWLLIVAGASVAVFAAVWTQRGPKKASVCPKESVYAG
jgi:hypothetical protein